MAEGVSDKLLAALHRVVAAVNALTDVIEAQGLHVHGHDEHEAGMAAQAEGPLPAGGEADGSERGSNGSFHAAASLCVPLNVSSEISGGSAGPISEISDKNFPKKTIKESKGPIFRENGSPAFPEGGKFGGSGTIGEHVAAAGFWRSEEDRRLWVEREALRRAGPMEDGAERARSSLEGEAVVGIYNKDVKRRAIADAAEQAGKEAYSGYRLPDLPEDQDGLPDLPKGDAGVVPKVDSFKDWYRPGKPWWRKW